MLAPADLLFHLAARMEQNFAVWHLEWIAAYYLARKALETLFSWSGTPLISPRLSEARLAWA